MGKGLVMMHIDGVGYRFLQRALEQGRMPKLAALIRADGYEVLPYRCGIPSTTPFCQAGILYGDNSEIPSYRWWDKEAKLLVGFGHGSSFKKVAGKYFKGRLPLTQDGAVIGACYPAGARDTFALAYRERDTSGPAGSGSTPRRWTGPTTRRSVWCRSSPRPQSPPPTTSPPSMGSTCCS